MGQQQQQQHGNHNNSNNNQNSINFQLQQHLNQHNQRNGYSNNQSSSNHNSYNSHSHSNNQHSSPHAGGQLTAHQMYNNNTNNPTNYEQSLQNMHHGLDRQKQKVGRPKGSTNKNKQSGGNMQFQDGQLMQVKKKGSGRPPKVIDEKKRKKKLNHVKRPMTAYLYFVSKYRQRLKDAGEPIPKAKEMTQECATKWRVMTPEQKSEYENLAKADRVRWEGEKAA